MNNLNDINQMQTVQQPVQQTNPYQQILDSESYNILTKCDPKLASAVLSIAVKKFSSSKEFLYFVKDEFKKEFEKTEDIEKPEVNFRQDKDGGKTENIVNNQSIQNTQSTQPVQQTQQNPSPSQISFDSW